MHIVRTNKPAFHDKQTFVANKTNVRIASNIQAFSTTQNLLFSGHLYHPFSMNLPA